MSNEVVRLSGDYTIQTPEAGAITLDTGVNTGTVIITGNLDVRGNMTTIESNNTKIKDNIIILNDGETNGYVTLGTAGIAIDRGNNASSTSSASLLYNDSLSWTVGGTTERGIWEFKSHSQYSAIKVDLIQMGSPTGADLDGRLMIFGTQIGMLNVGTNGGGTGALTPNIILSDDNDYASRVTDVNDIPNKYYVDHVVSLSTATSNSIEARRIKVGNTYVLIDDYTETGVASQIRAYIDNVQTVLIEANTVSLAGIAITSSTIRTTTINADLILLTSGTGNIIAESAVAFQVPYVKPTYTPNQVKVYSTSTPGAGSSGLLYVNNLGSDELTGARRAMVFSLVL